MSAITLVNSIPHAVAEAAEFRLFQGIIRVACVGVHAGGQAVIPTGLTVVDEGNNSEIPTAQIWTVYAVVNGITTQTLTVSDPNATIKAIAGSGGDGFVLVFS